MFVLHPCVAPTAGNGHLDATSHIALSRPPHDAVHDFAVRCPVYSSATAIIYDRFCDPKFFGSHATTERGTQSLP